VRINVASLGGYSSYGNVGSGGAKPTRPGVPPASLLAHAAATTPKASTTPLLWIASRRVKRLSA
jgi:hypothetical protein